MANSGEEFSITPPQSPTCNVICDKNESDEQLGFGKNIQDSLPCFVCLGEPDYNHLVFHSESYLKFGELNRVLKHEDPSFGYFDSGLTDFFGFKFLTDTSLTENCEQLFYMARQKYSKLEEHSLLLSHKFILSDKSKKFDEIRREIIKFLSCLKWHFVTHVHEDTDVQEVLPILKHIKGFLFHLGQISNVANYTILQQNNKRNSITPLYHLFHVHLDVIWSICAVLYSLPEIISNSFLIKLTDEQNNMESQNLFYQYSRIVIWDLLLLASKKFQNFSLHNYTQLTPFSCCCTRELWILIRCLLDENHKKEQGKSFWSTMQLIFQNILYEKVNSEDQSEINCDVFPCDSQLDCSDPIGFCWWLLLHLSHLYLIDSSGDVKSSCITSNYTLLQTLTVLTIQSEKTDEAHLRCYLRCCIEICRQWEPNTDILLPLVTYFIQRMNSNFCLPYSLDGLETLCQSGQSWLAQIKNRFGNPEKSSENSFYLFLGLISTQLSRLNDFGRELEWKMFKDRLLAKFGSRKVQELNDIGLHNFICLFLTLAYIDDFEEISYRLCSFLDMIPNSTLSSNQRISFWCGLFVLLGICQEKNIDMAFIAVKLSSAFTAVATQMKNQGLDSMERNQLKKMMTLYVKGVEEIVERSDEMALSEYLLFNVGIYNSLRNFDSEEIEQILAMIHAVLNKLKMLSTRSNRSLTAIQQQKALASILCKHVLPFVNLHCKTQTPPAILTDVAAGLTVMIADMSSLNVPESLQTSFSYFGLNSDIAPIFCCRYLCHILPQQKLMTRLLQEIKNIEYFILGSWLRSIIFLPENNRYVLEFTRLILKLPEIERLGVSYSNDTKVPFVIIKAISEKFNKIKHFPEKMVFRQKSEIIFKDVMKNNTSLLKNFDSLEQLRLSYQIMAHIVKYCAQIIYVKSKADNLLHTIVHQLLLPRIIYCHDKPLSPNLPIVLQENLHLFVEGLLSLNPRRDPCINNRLKDIVIQYILRFGASRSKPSSSNSVNPLLLCLQKCNSSGLQDFMIFALEVIRDQISYKKNQHFSVMINFVFQLTISVTEESRKQITQILMVSFLPLPAQVDANLRDAVNVIIRKMLTVHKKSDEIRLFVRPQIQKYLQDQMLINANHLFKSLEMLSEMDLSLVKNLAVDVAKSIENCEQKRGVGRDAALRNMQDKLLQKLSSSSTMI